jgi:hypothetical protein
VSTTTAMPADVDRWGRLARRTGIAGLISVGMLFAPFPALSILGKGEPPSLLRPNRPGTTSPTGVWAGRRW